MSKRWKNWEKQIIIKYYLTESSLECHKRLPHRTIGAIQKQAKELEVKGRYDADLTDNIYGIWEVVRKGQNYTSLKGQHFPRWWVKCTKCGFEKLVRASSLKNKKYVYTSCRNCPQLEIGKIYNEYLEPIKRLEDEINKKSGKHYQQFLVKCHYGAEGCRGEFPVRAESVLRGDTGSCGCLHRERMRKRLGKNNPNWKGGTTSLSAKYRDCIKYHKMQDKIFKRDNYCCIIKGKISIRECQLHHKIPRNYYFKKYNITTWEQVLTCKELWNLDNVVTISEEWHLGIKTDNPSALHRIYPGRVYKKEDYYSWLEVNLNTK